jgi:phosphate butyryltransferase
MYTNFYFFMKYYRFGGNMSLAYERFIVKDGHIRIAVAASEDAEVLEGLSMASEGLDLELILTGNQQKVESLVKEKNIKNARIIHADSAQEAAAISVAQVRDGNADMIMKGNLSTAVFLKAILQKEGGIRGSGLLSHLGLFSFEDRLIGITDAAMCISPDLESKAQIIRNAVRAFRALGFELPKVAALSAVEMVNPKIASTIDAALLAKMSDRGQIPHCVVDGPLALDNAVSKKAAELKGIHGSVAGQADILMVPHIESGNVLYKSVAWCTDSPMAGFLVGAAVPIVLSSRSDSPETKYWSIVMAAAVAKGFQRSGGAI